MSSIKQHVINFDIDTYLNPIVPSNQSKHLPIFLSRWLGYRAKEQEAPPALVVQLSAFIGILLGLLCVGAVYKYAPGISQYSPPVIIASLGASAILEYNTIQSPVAQPRNAVIGHVICATLGVAISKAFQNSADPQNTKWVAGAIACAVASLATGLTNTVYPPGGASAVLAAVSPDVIAMGWYFVPVILVGTAIMLGIALLVNNIARQFPVCWWSPEETGQAYKKDKQSDEEEQQQEDEKKDDDHNESESDAPLKNVDSEKSANSIFVSADELVLPNHIECSAEESHVLKLLQARLRAAK